jgi:hypothetical protein
MLAMTSGMLVMTASVYHGLYRPQWATWPVYGLRLSLQSHHGAAAYGYGAGLCNELVNQNDLYGSRSIVPISPVITNAAAQRMRISVTDTGGWVITYTGGHH